MGIEGGLGIVLGCITHGKVIHKTRGGETEGRGGWDNIISRHQVLVFCPVYLSLQVNKFWVSRNQDTTFFGTRGRWHFTLSLYVCITIIAMSGLIVPLDNCQLS